MASKKTDKTVDHISSYKPYYSEKQDLWKSELSYYVNGKRYRKNFCGKTKEILLQRIEAFKNEFYLIGNVDSDLRFDNFAINWMLTKEKFKLKPATYHTKFKTLTRYVIPAIGHIPINRLK